MKGVIRSVEDGDMARIAEIYNYYVLHTDISFETEPYKLAQIIANRKEIERKSPYLVIEENGEVLGYAYAKPWRSFAAYHRTFESSIYLDSMRNISSTKGYGTALYQALIEGLMAQKYAHLLFGVVTKGNLASDKLHQKLGFKKMAEFEEIGQKHGRWLGVTYWGKYL